MTKGKIKVMTTIREIIYRLRKGQSKRGIEKELGVHRTIIRRVFNLAVKQHWLGSDFPMPSDEEITKFWQQGTSSRRKHPLDVFREELEQWRNEGCSAVVIHQLIKDKISCDVQVIRRYINKHFPKPIDPVMVRPTVPGKDIDIDFGYLGKYLNEEGDLKKTWVFSFRLRHSRRAYREVVLNQNTNTFVMCHIYAFEWLGGVPEKVILDNCKAAIIKSTVDNDMVNRSYQELAEHYGFLISPCLPRTPEHKGGVESDVKYVKKNFLPFFRARQKEKNIEVSTVQQLAEALEKWGREIADIHLIHGVGRSPLDIFESEEKKALHPLPERRWEVTSWSQYTVRRDWRIMFDSSYYSVPYQLIGKEVQVYSTHSSVRIFYNHSEVAFHEKARKKWEYKRKSEHAPPFHEEVLQCSREGLLLLAEKNGPFTYQVVHGILSHPSVDKLRPVRQLLKLAKKYSQQRLEGACRRAANYKMFSYISVKNILENYLDQEANQTCSPNKIVHLQQYRFVRDPDDYRCAELKPSFTERLEALHPYSKHGNAMMGVYECLLADQIMEEEEK